MVRSLSEHIKIFNKIARIYQIFYSAQSIGYYKMLIKYFPRDLLPEKKNNKKYNVKILDLGCGTGAFTNAFKKFGFITEGIDLADGMIKRAKDNKLDCKSIDFLSEISVFNNNYWGIVGGYFLHGLNYKLRRLIIEKAVKKSSKFVLFYDYLSGNRAKFNPIISFLETLEDGDYYQFKKTAELEFLSIAEKYNLSFELIPTSKTTGFYLLRL